MNYDQNLSNTLIALTSLSVNLYSTFKRKNSEKFFELLLKGNFSQENIEEFLEKIKTDDYLRRHLYYIINAVDNELVEEKIKLWANAYDNLYEDIYSNELFLKTTNDITYLEYLILNTYIDNNTTLDMYPESSTLIAKNRLVASGLLINKNYTEGLTWDELSSKKSYIHNEYELSEFGAKLLEFLSNKQNERTQLP